MNLTNIIFFILGAYFMGMIITAVIIVIGEKQSNEVWSPLGNLCMCVIWPIPLTEIFKSLL